MSRMLLSQQFSKIDAAVLFLENKKKILVYFFISAKINNGTHFTAKICEPYIAVYK